MNDVHFFAKELYLFLELESLSALYFPLLVVVPGC